MPTYRPSNPKLNIPDRQTTTDFTNKSLEELISELVNDRPRNLDPGELGKAARQLDLIDTTNRATIIQMEMTRRLIIELQNSTKSTNLLNIILIILTAILAIQNIFLIVQSLSH